MDRSSMAGPEASDFRRFRPPLGLLGMLALVVGVESFIARHGLEFRDTGDWAWAVAGRSAKLDGPGREVLVFGDSQAKLALAPALVEASSGRSTYNLAICGGQAPSSYFLLRRSINSGAQPSAILVDFFPKLLQLGPRHTLNWPALLEPLEALDLAWVARDPGLFASIEVARILPSLRARQGIRTALLAFLDGRPNPWASETPVYRRNWRMNLGAQIMPGGAGVKPATDLVKLRQDFYSDLKFDPVNVVYMERFLALAASRSIPVYYLVPPLQPGLQAESERSGFDAAYVAFLKEIQSRYPNVAVADGRRALYDPAVFFDPLHLGRDGAWAYSLAIGDLLRRHPPEHPCGSRWIELPRYAGLPVGSPPEDIEQSRAAFETRRVARRSGRALISDGR
jgi:hypothetical protein